MKGMMPLVLLAILASPGSVAADNAADPDQTPAPAQSIAELQQQLARAKRVFRRRRFEGGAALDLRTRRNATRVDSPIRVYAGRHKSGAREGHILTG